MRRFVVICCVFSFLLVVGCGSGPETPDTPKSDFPAAVFEYPSMTVLALAETGPYAEFETTLDRVGQYLQEKGIRPDGELMGVFFDDPATIPPDKTTYEIRVPVAPGTEVDPPYVVLETEGGLHATVRLIGPYDNIRAHIPKLYEWIAENEYEPAGAMWEIYIVHPGSGVPPEEYDTEIHVPVRPAGILEVPEEPMEEGATEEPMDEGGGE